LCERGSGSEGKGQPARSAALGSCEDLEHCSSPWRSSGLAGGWAQVTTDGAGPKVRALPPSDETGSFAAQVPVSEDGRGIQTTRFTPAGVGVRRVPDLEVQVGRSRRGVAAGARVADDGSRLHALADGHRNVR